MSHALQAQRRKRYDRSLPPTCPALRRRQQPRERSAQIAGRGRLYPRAEQQMPRPRPRSQDGIRGQRPTPIRTGSRAPSQDLWQTRSIPANGTLRLTLRRENAAYRTRKRVITRECLQRRLPPKSHDSCDFNGHREAQIAHRRLRK